MEHGILDAIPERETLSGKAGKSGINLVSILALYRC